jgi:protein-disulfide isomerase
MRSQCLWFVVIASGLLACSPKSEPPTAAPAPANPVPPEAEPSPTPDGYVQVPLELLPRLSRPDSPMLGSAKAPVTLVEFLDPACEACRTYAPVVKQIQFLYPNEVRLVVRFADFHPGSDEAIRLVLAARLQNKMEEVLNALFAAQDQWVVNHTVDGRKVWEVAATTSLAMSRARRDAASAKITERLRQETEDVLALQVARTPTFYVNGKLLMNTGAQPLLALVSAEVKAAALRSSPAAAP